MGVESDSSSTTTATTATTTTTTTTNSPTTASPNGKRCRDPEDEIYVDNLHSHKRYLSEIMASSLNGLTVGDSMAENLMDSPARDELSSQYSPMSEDSDESRFCESNIVTCESPPDSRPASPVSPHRYQRSHGGFYSAHSTSSYPSHGSTVAAAASSQSRHRSSDSEGRFPSSPSDICHSADLRRAALLRSVQMRTQPPGPPSLEMLGKESVSNMEAEERRYSCMKSLVDEERDYHIEECPPVGVPEPEFSEEKASELLNRSFKGEA